MAVPRFRTGQIVVKRWSNGGQTAVKRVQTGFKQLSNSSQTVIQHRRAPRPRWFRRSEPAKQRSNSGRKRSNNSVETRNQQRSNSSQTAVNQRSNRGQTAVNQRSTSGQTGIKSVQTAVQQRSTSGQPAVNQRRSNRGQTAVKQRRAPWPWRLRRSEPVNQRSNRDQK